MKNLEQNLIKIADNVQKIYEFGKEVGGKVKEELTKINDCYSNALKGEKKDNLVSLSDVSPVAHNIKVEVITDEKHYNLLTRPYPCTLTKGDYKPITVQVGGHHDLSAVYTVIVKPLVDAETFEITDVVAKSGKAYKRANNSFDVGSKLYSDRDYVYTSIDEQFKDCAYIMTCNDDKNNTIFDSDTSDFLSFKINKPAMVYLLMHQNINNPAWMYDWEHTSTNAFKTDGSMKLEHIFSKQFGVVDTFTANVDEDGCIVMNGKATVDNVLTIFEGNIEVDGKYLIKGIEKFEHSLKGNFLFTPYRYNGNEWSISGNLKKISLTISKQTYREKKIEPYFIEANKENVNPDEVKIIRYGATKEEEYKEYPVSEEGLTHIGSLYPQTNITTHRDFDIIVTYNKDINKIMSKVLLDVETIKRNTQ